MPNASNDNKRDGDLDLINRLTFGVLSRASRAAADVKPGESTATKKGITTAEIFPSDLSQLMFGALSKPQIESDQKAGHTPVLNKAEIKSADASQSKAPSSTAVEPKPAKAGAPERFRPIPPAGHTPVLNKAEIEAAPASKQSKAPSSTAVEPKPAKAGAPERFRPIPPAIRTPSLEKAEIKSADASQSKAPSSTAVEPKPAKAGAPERFRPYIKPTKMQVAGRLLTKSILCLWRPTYWVVSKALSAVKDWYVRQEALQKAEHEAWLRAERKRADSDRRPTQHRNTWDSYQDNGWRGERAAAYQDSWSSSSSLSQSSQTWNSYGDIGGCGGGTEVWQELSRQAQERARQDDAQRAQQSREHDHQKQFGY